MAYIYIYTHRSLIGSDPTVLEFGTILLVPPLERASPDLQCGSYVALMKADPNHLSHKPNLGFSQGTYTFVIIVLPLQATTSSHVWNMSTIIQAFQDVVWFQEV